jgi:hypothetical protein
MGALQKSHSHAVGSSDESAKAQRERALGEALVMWRSLLSIDAGGAAGGPPLSLQRQLSISKHSKDANGKNSKRSAQSNGHALLDHLVQFLRSDTDIDPSVAQEREKSRKNKASAAASSAGADGDAAGSGASKQDDDAVRLSTSHLLQFLLIRRHRAISRSVGFRFLSQLLCSAPNSAPTPFLSVQQELLKYLAPALRGSADKDAKSTDLAAAAARAPADDDADLASDSEGEDYEAARKGSSGRDDEAVKEDKNKAGFVYTSDLFGAGPRLSSQLAKSFQQLFQQLARLLHGQVRALLHSAGGGADQAAADDAPSADWELSPRGPTGPTGPTGASATVAPLSSDALSLAVLASLAQSFSPSDHPFLDSSGLIHTIRRLMELDVTPTPASIASAALAAKLSASAGGKAALTAPVQAASSKLKLKESAWFTFRLLALSVPRTGPCCK